MKVYLSRYMWISSLSLYLLFWVGYLGGFFLEYVPFKTPLLRIIAPVVILMSTKLLFTDIPNLYMTATIGRDKITSRLLWKEHGTVYYDRPIYFFYFEDEFKEDDREVGLPASHYIAISNSPIQFPSSAKHKLLSFDRKKVIVLPDTEKVRSALDRYIAQENRYEQNTPPPVEELKKKKKEKAPLPVVEKALTSDDPAPLTSSKWDVILKSQQSKDDQP